MLPYRFLLKNNTNIYLYITFKHYNTQQQINNNKKEYYCTRKACVMSLVTL